MEQVDKDLDSIYFKKFFEISKRLRKIEKNLSIVLDEIKNMVILQVVDKDGGPVKRSQEFIC